MFRDKSMKLVILHLSSFVWFVNSIFIEWISASASYQSSNGSQLLTLLSSREVATVSQFYKALCLIIIYVAAKGTACSDLCHIYAYLSKYFFEAVKVQHFEKVSKPTKVVWSRNQFSKFEIMKNIKRHLDIVWLWPL